jgi:hypothetical protein
MVFAFGRRTSSWRVHPGRHRITGRGSRGGRHGGEVSDVLADRAADFSREAAVALAGELGQLLYGRAFTSES